MHGRNLNRRNEIDLLAVLKQITVRGTPPSPRSGHSAVALGESLVVYGGMNGQDGVTFNDMFELRPGMWEFASIRFCAWF